MGGHIAWNRSEADIRLHSSKRCLRKSVAHPGTPPVSLRLALFTAMAYRPASGSCPARSRRMTARTIILTVAALALASAGCSHNPGYFPYLIPGGPIAESHAKPGGRGYFKNFDPKACKLEISPNQQINAPVGTQVVLLGTVVDKDGQPRRSRRIEWMVEGPGNIVEADESGAFPGRGYKKDNKYAVTYTNYVTKTITRGNTDDGDDVIVAPGQTFCVISSAVPGETVITGYAPEVFNWDNGRVVVKINWGDGRFSFPAPAVVRFGGEHTLTTTVSSTAAEGSPSGYRIRYKVLEGPPTTLMSRSGTSTSTSQSGSSNEAEAVTDVNGEGAIRLVQPSPKAGKTRVAVEIVKPAESGTGPGTVVSRRETVIEWAEPRIHLAVNAPTAAGVGTTFPVTITLDNDGSVDSRDARVKLTLSDGATLERSEPPPSRQDAAGGITFDLPPVLGKGKQEVTLQVKPARLGQVSFNAEVATADGLQANTRAVTRIEQGKLQMLVEGPASAIAGESIPFKVAVTNSGAVAVDNVTVWARYDEGLRYAAPANPVELSAGTIAPGQTKTLDLPLTAAKSGRYGVRATATADGSLTATGEPVAVDVQRAELVLAATGPRLVYLNQDFEWNVTVRNTGDAAVSNVVVRASLPTDVKIKAVEGAKVGAGSVEWTVPEMRAGEQRTYRIPATATRLTDRATLTASVLADATSGAKTVGDPVGSKAESSVAIIGTPAVSLVLTAPAGLVEVGKRATFTIKVKNEGTVSARKIELTGFVPPELRPVRGTGAVLGIPNGPAPLLGRIEGTGRVVFPPMEELRPGETVTFTVDVDAVQAGDARFRVEVAASHLTSPLKEEQAARVTAK
ncbi:MAG: hypothetical protein C0467_10820 [Planctomycetaceae bacterium]|nr:hypothetical protein [Planctomycetaceae bacterium]